MEAAVDQQLLFTEIQNQSFSQGTLFGERSVLLGL